MGWIINKIRKIAGTEDLTRRIAELEKTVESQTEHMLSQTERMLSQETLHAEDYKFLAERVYAIEEEVFDTSAVYIPNSDDND